MGRRTFKARTVVRSLQWGALVLGWQAGVAVADPLALVTEEEAQASRARPVMGTRAVPAPDAPRINLVVPNIANPVPTPTPIQLRFEAVAPATIKPETFKVRYGSFKIDITSRILAASKVLATGVDVAEAALPKGDHRLFVEIQDSLGRAVERQLQFVVN